LQRRTGLCFYLKKGLLWLKMLLRRRNTTSLMIPSFDTSYKPWLLRTNKTPYLQSDHSEQFIYRNQGRKSNPDF
jgi:hypothetical protein